MLPEKMAFIVSWTEEDGISGTHNNADCQGEEKDKVMGTGFRC